MNSRSELSVVSLLASHFSAMESPNTNNSSNNNSKKRFRDEEKCNGPSRYFTLKADSTPNMVKYIDKLRADKKLRVKWTQLVRPLPAFVKLFGSDIAHSIMLFVGVGRVPYSEISKLIRLNGLIFHISFTSLDRIYWTMKKQPFLLDIKKRGEIFNRGRTLPIWDNWRIEVVSGVYFLVNKNEKTRDIIDYERCENTKTMLLVQYKHDLKNSMLKKVTFSREVIVIE